jgi:hypothetical protein
MRATTEARLSCCDVFARERETVAAARALRRGDGEWVLPLFGGLQGRFAARAAEQQVPYGSMLLVLGRYSDQEWY